MGNAGREWRKVEVIDPLMPVSCAYPVSAPSYNVEIGNSVYPRSAPLDPNCAEVSVRATPIPSTSLRTMVCVRFWNRLGVEMMLRKS